LAVVLFACAAIAHAQSGAANLEAFLGKVAAADVVPGADRFRPVRGSPLVAPAYRATSCSATRTSTPSTSMPAATRASRSTSSSAWTSTARSSAPGVVSHGEPIVLIGIPEQKVVTYLQAFVGYNPNHHASVSVAARHATLADGLSTTLSVLPPAQGIALLERFPSTRATSWTPPAGSGRTACPDGEKRGRPPCAPRTADGAGDARDTASRPCPFPGRPNRS
jgi:NosR/NirI family nitrous oxide reductase transcriptional regulator